MTPIEPRLGNSPLPVFFRSIAFDPRAHTVCSDCCLLFTAAQSLAGTLVARSTSLCQSNPTGVVHRIVELTSRSCVTMYATSSHAVGRLWCSPACARNHSAFIACVPGVAMSSTRSISLLMLPLMVPSLFLPCHIRTPRNDTVRLDIEMTIRSTAVSAACCQSNLNQLCAEALRLQVDGEVIPITQLPSG